MDLQQTISDHWSSRVLFLPIGVTSKASVAEVTAAARQTPNVKLSSTVITFVYLNAEPTNEWNDFQYHRRIAAVVGVLDDIPENAGVDLELELPRLQAQFPHATQVWCIARDHRGDADSFINPGPNPTISKSDAEVVVNGKVKAVMLHIGQVLSEAYETVAREKTAERPELVKLLTTPLEVSGLNGKDLIPPASTSRAYEAYRKRCTARLQKQIGDICMLLGKPQQASEYYNFAVKIFKDTNDFLWLGCALEGCGACILLDAEVGNVEAVFEGNDADRELEVIGRFREASNLYTRYKGAIRLRMEVIFKLTAFLRHNCGKLEAMQELSSVFDIPYQDQIDDEGQLELLLTLGARHKEMGMQRKAAFYFRRAALLRWRTFGQDDVAHCMLVQIADIYGLEGMVDFLNGNDGGVPLKPGTAEGWPMLQAVLVREVMDTAINLEDTQRKARIVSMFANRVTDPRASQLLPVLLTELERASPAVIVPQGLRGVPVIHNIEICDLPPHLKPGTEVQPRRGDSNGGANSVFIYTPIRSAEARKAAKPKQWVAGEPTLVKVTISNPLSCNLAVEMLCLHAKGVRFEGYPSGPIMLPRRSERYEVMLEGKALETGALLIEGCTARAFNVDSMHVVEPQQRIEVIPALPLLRVQTIPRCAETETTVALLHGEDRAIRLRLENCSAIPVVRLQLKMHTFENPRDVAVIEFSKGSTEAAGRLALGACTVSSKLRSPVLPLPPTSFADLDVVLHGCSLALTGVVFTVRYSGSELDSDGDGDGSDGNGSGSGGGGASSSAVSSSVAAATAAAATTLPTPADIFYRTMIVTVPISMQPSITITAPEILSLNGTPVVGAGYSADEQCLLTFAVQNETSKAISVKVSSSSNDGGAGAGGDSDCEVHDALVHNASSEVFLLPMKRLQPSGTGQDALAAAAVGNHRRGVAAASASNKRAAAVGGGGGAVPLSLELQHRLKQAIQISWKASRFVHGKLSFPAELLPASAERLLTRRRLSIRFGAGTGSAATYARKHVCKLFGKVEVAVTVSNVSDQPQPPLVLSILPFQDLERGSRNYTMSGRLEWVGSLECKVEVLQPGQVFVHKVTFVCFAAGIYQLSAQCRYRHGGSGGGNGSNSGSVGASTNAVGTAVVQSSSEWKFGDDPSLFQPDMGSNGINELGTLGSDQSAGWCDARLELIARL